MQESIDFVDPVIEAVIVGFVLISWLFLSMR
jgi:hypothetical protein